MSEKRALVATYGRYTVYHDPLLHRPWGLYRIYAGEKYIGAQISFPNASDCAWVAAQKAGEIIYAKNSHRWTSKDYGRRRGITSPASIKWRKEKAAA